MKSTIADVRQLFNVKEIAFDTTIDALADGQLGIFPEDSDTSIEAADAQFDALPDSFRIISKLGGKVYYSFDCIEKNAIYNQLAKAYQPQVGEVWKVTPDDCACIKSAQLRINIDEDSLIRRDGLTWTHTDFVVELSPKELECLCDTKDADLLSDYQNNVFVELLARKVNEKNSPFYEARVEDEAGAVVADVPAFIAANKVVNTDDDDTNDGGKLVLVIVGKVQPTPNYRDLEVNYIYPRGTRLQPVLLINEETATAFTQDTDLQYEINAGYDLRAEEFDCMSLYTNLNNYPQLSDGIASADLIYQFENQKNYSTVTFEYGSKKVERAGDGDRKGFVVCLAAEVRTPAIAQLNAIFLP